MRSMANTGRGLPIRTTNKLHSGDSAVRTIVVGIDPDSERHGVAYYFDGVLCYLEMMNTVGIFDKILKSNFGIDQYIFSIENVMANQFVYARNRKGSTANQSKIAMHIGRCQQAQVELMRWLDHYGIPYVLHKPQKGNWADNKAQFEKVTGWTKQSNADTRSAAYFGYLALG